MTESTEFMLMIEMLERIAEALRAEAQPPPHRYSRHNVGAAAENLRYVAQQLRHQYTSLFRGRT